MMQKAGVTAAERLEAELAARLQVDAKLEAL
jgi:hypothetical protein